MQLKRKIAMLYICIYTFIKFIKQANVGTKVGAKQRFRKVNSVFMMLFFVVYMGRRFEKGYMCSKPSYRKRQCVIVYSLDTTQAVNV